MLSMKNRHIVAQKASHVHPQYKVYLLNDPINKFDYVQRVLIRVIDDMVMYEAKEKTTEAHNRGVSLLRICDQEKASDICDNLRLNGLLSRIEP